jgi:hypothetical protein
MIQVKHGEPVMKEEVAFALMALNVDPTAEMIEDLHFRLALNPLSTGVRSEAVLAAVTSVRQDLERVAGTDDVVVVPEMNGICSRQRVVVTDVQASPPEEHYGKVTTVWSDGTAFIDWDDNRLNLQRDRHLVVNGRVDLHHVRPVAVASREHSFSPE